MSGHHQPPEGAGPAHPAPGQPYPPPGAPAYPVPGQPQPGYGQPPPGPQGHPGPAAPHWHRPAAPRPGAVPLRPLGFNDLYDGAFRIIRYNPMATVGSAVLVSAAAMLVPVVGTAVLTWLLGTSLEVGADAEDDVLGLLGSVGALGIGLVLQGLGMILVTGMVAQVVGAAVVGRRLSLGEAWRATHGRRWRLVGLTFLLGLASALAAAAYVLLWVLVVAVADPLLVVAFGVVSVPAFLALMAWFWIRVYYLPATVLMLEQVGVLQAVGRGYRLTSGHYWRVFGIALATFMVTQIAGGVLGAPFGFLAQAAVLVVGPEYALLALVLGQALSTVVAAAVVGPFTTAVAALQYVDLRMRKEGFDVELLARAGADAR